MANNQEDKKDQNLKRKSALIGFCAATQVWNIVT